MRINVDTKFVKKNFGCICLVALVITARLYEFDGLTQDGIKCSTINVVLYTIAQCTSMIYSRLCHS